MEESAREEIPILIVDKEGILGEGISQRLSKEAKIVLVSSKEVNAQNIIFIPFGKKIPVIPGINYSFIFVVYDPSVLKKELLLEIVKKAKEDDSVLVVVCSIFNKNSELSEELKDIYSKVKIALLGEVFGKNLPSDYSFANKILTEAMKNKKIKVSHKGLLKIYPLEFEDAVLEIIKAGFSNKKIFYLFSNPLTELSFVGIIQKTEPMLKIDFEKEDLYEEREIDIPERGEQALLNYPLQSRMKEALEGIGIENKEVSIRNNGPRKKKRENKKYIFTTLLLIAVFLIPFLTSLVFSFFGAWQLRNLLAFIEKSELNRAKISSLLAKNSFSLASFSYDLSIIKTSDISKNIKKGKKASEIFYQGIAPYEKIKEGNFSEGSYLLKEAISNLSLLEEGLSPSEKSMVKKFEPSLILLGNLIDIAPEFLGFNGKRKYLLLFQNNMELRPGGGFIGSYGLLTLEKGKILDFTIQDVYSADGQLKGHVEPPFAIRRYLPLVHWYLRDSNFSPDFKINAQKAAFFLKNEISQEVGGVIAIDVSFVKSLLLATGPLYISDFDETVTFDNFYLLTQSHSERNFFPGSTQKRDFLRSLFTSLKSRLSDNKISQFKLLPILSENIRQKHVLFYSDNKNVQKVFEINKMSSILSDEREKGEDIVNDFLGISEANLGVNKANYFVKRKIDQKIRIEGRDLLGKVEISYKNLSETWPGGDYKNFLQLILPKNAKLLSIIIDGEEQKTTKAVTNPLIYEAKNFRPPKELEVETKEEEGKTIFGFLVMIGQGDLRKIEVSYRIDDILGEALAFSYNLRIFKQPGTEEYPYSFELSSPDFKILKGQNSFKTNLTSDLDLVFKLAKK